MMLPLLVLCTVASRLVSSQIGPQTDSNNQYYLDKHCNRDTTFNIYDKEAVVFGHGTTEVQNSPDSCTLQLSTENNFEKAIFRIIVRNAKIKTQGVRLTIYDGTPGVNTLASYDFENGKTQTELRTTGRKVSFVLTRVDPENYQYDLEFVVTPIVSGVNPGPENGWGGDYGYFNTKVPNKVLYIIVGVLFLIVIVIIIIVAIVCHRKQKGLNKKAEEYKISYINQSVGGAGTIPQHYEDGSQASTRQWISTSRSSLHRHRAPRHYSDDDSVFDASVDSFPTKKGFDIDRSYDFPNSCKNARDEKLKNKAGYRNNIYVQADDDHPKSTYIQREMTARVRPSQSIEAGKEFADETTDHEEEEEDEEEEEEGEEEEETEEEDYEEDDASAVDQTAPISLNPQRMHPPYPGNPNTRGPAPYSLYPGYPQPHFIPIVTGPGQFQTDHVPSLAMPPVQQSQAKNQVDRARNMMASDPPIYSYLVQRGYKPVDGCEFPASVSTNASGQSDTHLIQPDEADLPNHNLTSGVEYMRR